MAKPIQTTPPEPIPHEQALAREDSRLCADSAAQLDSLTRQNRLRGLQSVSRSGKSISIDGRSLLNFASNDYLALADHPRLIEAVIDATRRFGVGSGASRLVCGNQPIHEGLEQRFAAFKHAQAALLLPTGYTANLAAITALAGPDDLIVMDKLVHASLIDAARACKATLRTFPHLDLNRAETLLKRSSAARRFLVTDSVFSMDGDCADLPALCDLADRYHASLIVDEAHGTGVLGQDGSGLASAQGVAQRVYTCGTGGIVISTASKALGSLGGIVTADRPVIDLIINKARPFIYSTAVPPAQAAAIDAALDVIRDEPQRREQLAQRSREMRIKLADAGWASEPLICDATDTPIFPLVCGDELGSLALQARLYEAGIFAPAIRPPTVAVGSARVRLSLRADLTQQDLDQTIKAIGTP